MRLLHTTELRFQEFFDVDVPRYAILSHRWGPDEVSYQDFRSGTNQGGAGYRKITECCAYVANDLYMYDRPGDSYASQLRHRFGSLNQKEYCDELCKNDWVWIEDTKWVWIDTCCIDKSSSAELSEAINSMCHWYARSEVCYAYLSDIAGHSRAEIEGSRWFTRGWTLQELLAPFEVVFLNKHWQELSRKTDNAQTFLPPLTGISHFHLSGLQYSPMEKTCAAEKFMWAAKRSTTRIEDQAYCLLGLFNVNMSLLYGEGNRAFSRLQRKIIKSSDDESVFLSDSRTRRTGSVVTGGVLARSVSGFCFPDSHRLPRLEFSRVTSNRSPYTVVARPPYTITNQGLQFHVPKKLALKREILLPLSCVHYSIEKYKNLGHQGVLEGAYAIRLQKVTGAGKEHEGKWIRIKDAEYWTDDLPQLSRTVYRLPEFSGLYIVPVEWVWSREDLAKRGSEIIYVRL